MPKVPLPQPRPDYFEDRFAIKPYPQFRTGTDEAARETLQGMMKGSGPDLEKFIQQLLLREALAEPFNPNFKEPAIMAEPKGPDEITPVPLLVFPEPNGDRAYGRFEPKGDFEYDYVQPSGYHRIGFPEAINPRTFMSRLNESMNPTFEKDWTRRIKGSEDMMPQVDEADDMVKNEINKGD